MTLVICVASILLAIAVIFQTPTSSYAGRSRKRCPHSNLCGIYGDEVNHVGYRLYCYDCARYLDGPVSLAECRKDEPWNT